jgi:hypothetical protein
MAGFDLILTPLGPMLQQMWPIVIQGLVVTTANEFKYSKGFGTYPLHRSWFWVVDMASARRISLRSYVLCKKYFA